MFPKKSTFKARVDANSDSFTEFPSHRRLESKVNETKLKEVKAEKKEKNEEVDSSFLTLSTSLDKEELFYKMPAVSEEHDIFGFNTSFENSISFPDVKNLFTFVETNSELNGEEDLGYFNFMNTIFPEEEETHSSSEGFENTRSDEGDFFNMTILQNRWYYEDEESDLSSIDSYYFEHDKGKL
eukprot:snap_masked-scaffold_2-processed-gene-20.19-mRNA-1 protein AED:1.00 eAED:1.00 QI:0/-1/0/0/-1/1/1/0/182